MALADVTPFNEHLVWLRVYKNPRPSGKPVFAFGDLVRLSLSRAKAVFQKSYEGNWSREVFVIDKVLLRNPVVYKIRDSSGEKVEGVFYKQELQRVREAALPEGLYHVDQIIKSGKRKGVPYSLVKWRDHEKPTWIPTADLVQL